MDRPAPRRALCAAAARSLLPGGFYDDKLSRDGVGRACVHAPVRLLGSAARVGVSDADAARLAARRRLRRLR
jgi:hypothetical protein